MKNLSIIEALRGVAAMTVMIFHFSVIDRGASEWWVDMNSSMHLGVQIFFVISGFVIPLQLTRKQYTVRKFFQFQANRFIRIYPAYLIMCVSAATLWFIQFKFLGGEQAPDLSLKNIIQNLTLSAWALDGIFYLGVSWTLTIEFTYYLFMGLAFPLLFSENTRIRIPSNIAFLAAHFFINPDPLWNFFAWIPYFATGFYLFRIKDGKAVREATIFLLASLIIIGFDPGYRASIHHVIVMSAVSLLILFAKDFKSKALLFAGSISYSLYLAHDLFAPKILDVMRKTGIYDVLGFFPTLLFLIICSFLISYVFYRVIEVPSHRMSKKAWSSNRPKPAVANP